MSFDAHEAVSFDSFYQSLIFFDDFEGDALKDLWDSTINGAGTIAVVDAETGGAVKLTTGAVLGNDCQIDWNGIRSLHVDQKVVMEIRVKLSSIADIKIRLALMFNFNNSVIFRYDTTTDTNWIIRCRDDAANTEADSGIAPTTNYVVLRMECTSTAIRYFIDGVEAANSPLITNIPSDAGDYLMPLLRVQTATGGAKSLDVDYCYIRQERG